MVGTDEEYHRVREARERDKASRAKGSAARLAHRKLAALHAVEAEKSRDAAELKANRDRYAVKDVGTVTNAMFVHQ